MRKKNQNFREGFGYLIFDGNYLWTYFREKKKIPYKRYPPREQRLPHTTVTPLTTSVLTSGVDAGVVLSLVGVAGEKIVHDDVFMDVLMLCLDDLFGEFRDGKLSVFVHSARLRPIVPFSEKSVNYRRNTRGLMKRKRRV